VGPARKAFFRPHPPGRGVCGGKKCLPAPDAGEPRVNRCHRCRLHATIRAAALPSSFHACRPTDPDGPRHPFVRSFLALSCREGGRGTEPAGRPRGEGGVPGRTMVPSGAQGCGRSPARGGQDFSGQQGKAIPFVLASGEKRWVSSRVWRTRITGSAREGAEVATRLNAVK
jgi:hypothetical protein